MSSVIAKSDDLENQRRSVVFGSTDFIDNIRLHTGGNAELFINAVDFLLRKDLKTTVAPKNENLNLSVPQPEQTRAILVFVLLWLVLCVVIAAAVLLRRRNRVKK